MGWRRDVYQALDLRRVDALLADALHFVLAVGPAGLSAGAEEADEERRASRRSRAHACPAGVDAAAGGLARARASWSPRGAEERGAREA